MSAPASSQIGYKLETTWGVHATPDRFLPLLTADLEHDIERMESEAVVAGLDIIGSEQWAAGNVTAGGSVGHELYAGGLDFLLKLILGDVDITGSGPYTKVFFPVDGELPSATVQIGRARPGGAVIPENWVGAKASDWEIACAQGEIATFGASLTAKKATFGTRSVSDGATTNTDATVTSSTGAFTDADLGKLVTGTGIPAGATIAAINSSTSIELSAPATATGTGVALVIGAALGTASYAAGSTTPLHFVNASLDIHGSSVDFTDLTISGDNGLKTDRRFNGSGLIHEQLREGRRSFTASVTKEYLGIDQRTLLLNGAEGDLVLNFTLGAASVQLEGNVRYDKTASKVDPKKISEEELDLKFVLPAESTDLADAIKITTVNAASTV